MELSSYRLDIANVSWMWAFFFFMAVDVVLFLISWLKDPGFVKKDKQVNMLDMLRRYDCSMICAEC
jgi:palmitoyltransferase